MIMNQFMFFISMFYNLDRMWMLFHQQTCNLNYSNILPIIKSVPSIIAIVNQAHATGAVVTAVNNKVNNNPVNIKDYENVQNTISCVQYFNYYYYILWFHFFLPPFFGSATTAFAFSLLSLVPVTSSKKD